MKLTALAGGRHRAPLRPLPAMDLPFLVLVLTLVGFGVRLPPRVAPVSRPK